MKLLRLTPLFLLFLISCTKNSVDNNVDEPAEVNPPISATPIIKDMPGYLGMPGNAAYLASDNNILICGSDSTPNGNSNGKFNVVKFSKTGSVIWEKSYKIGEQSWGCSITELNGNYYAVGKVWITATYATMRHRVFLVKMTPTGDTVWTKYYTINHADQSECKIITTKDNNLVIGGCAEDNNNHAFVMKVNPDGDMIWGNVYPVGTEDVLRNITETANGDYLVTGMYTDNTHNYYCTMFERINSAGTKLWDKKTDLERYLYSSAELPDGSIVTTGYKIGAIYGWVQVYLDKCDNAGNPVLQKDYGDDNINEIGHTIKYNSNNTLTIGGISQGQFYILNTDLDGNVLWKKSFGSVNENEMSMIGDKLDNNLLFGFKTVTMQVKPLPAPTENVSTIYFTKLDKDGNFF